MSTTLAGPRLISDAVSAALPLPTLTEFNRALRGELESVPDGHNSYDAYWEARKAALLKQHGVTNIAQLPFNIDGLLLQEGEEHANPIIDRHFGALWDHLERQNRLRTFAGLLAPPLALEAVSMALAGSDFAHHRQFAHAAEAQRRLMVKLLNDDMAANSKYGDWDYEAGVALWSKVPEFRYAAPDTAFALRQARTGLGILLTWLLASAGLLLLSARKLKP
jgi:ABC-2 type transport system permease protein